MKISDKLIKRMREELDMEIPVDASVGRTYVGHWQKKAGAWTSFLKSEIDPRFEIGFYSRIVDLVKCPKLEIYHNQFDNVVECGCIGRCKGLKEE